LQKAGQRYQKAVERTNTKQVQQKEMINSWKSF